MHFQDMWARHAEYNRQAGYVKPSLDVALPSVSGDRITSGYDWMMSNASCDPITQTTCGDLSGCITFTNGGVSLKASKDYLVTRVAKYVVCLATQLIHKWVDFSFFFWSTTGILLTLYWFNFKFMPIFWVYLVYTFSGLYFIYKYIYYLGQTTTLLMKMACLFSNSVSLKRDKGLITYLFTQFSPNLAIYQSPHTS